MKERCIAEVLALAGKGQLVSSTPLSGGGICRVMRLDTDRGESICLKQARASTPVPDNFFAAEAAGLQALANAQSGLSGGARVRIPQPISYDEHYLALDYIAAGRPDENSWRQLAEGLALMHSTGGPYFGFEQDNYCGATPQPNQPCDDGFTFFVEQRLGFQVALALQNNLLDQRDARRLESLTRKLPGLLPKQQSGLIHGDLWSGNVLFDTAGQPVLIDPACHYGWPEADLAMTALFGGFPDGFYRHYDVVRPLEKGWRGRFPLYNLYHLLNHLNLFGSRYYSQVMAIVSRFA